jgi:hypothetical protein
MKTRILLCFLFALTLGCVEKVTLKNESFTPQPVILAELNSEGNLRVQVSLTTNIDEESINNFVEDATIRLWTKNTAGDDEIVTDSFEYGGLDNAYFPTSSIEAVQGGIYWIELALSNGISYISSQEKMPVPVEVSEIAYVNNQLRAIFQDQKDEPNYYRAEFDVFSKERRYYITSLSVVSNDVLFDGNKKAYIGEYTTISEASFHVELNMESLSSSSYLFYRNFLEQEDLNTGTIDDDEGDPGWLFSKPPLNLYGNIREKESGKKVLGQFVISSISRKSQIVE